MGDVSPDPGPTAAPAPSRRPSGDWLTEAQRKAIHIGCIVLPLALLFEWLPWPHGKGQWMLFLTALTLTAITIDVIRIHDRRVGQFFRRFVGELIREHERFNLLGSTYLLIAALLAVEIFPQRIAAAALGFTILGDGMAALVGKGLGRTRIYNKTLEGALGGLAACLVWGAFLATMGFLPWPMVLTGALVASLVELLPIPLDDNVGITLFAGYAMKLFWSAG